MDIVTSVIFITIETLLRSVYLINGSFDITISKPTKLYLKHSILIVLISCLKYHECCRRKRQSLSLGYSKGLTVLVTQLEFRRFNRNASVSKEPVTIPLCPRTYRLPETSVKDSRNETEKRTRRNPLIKSIPRLAIRGCPLWDA